MRQLLFVFLFGAFSCHAQDTLKILTLDAFLLHVKENHPVSVVASNQVESAKLFIQQSKGSFDPVLLGGVDQKLYNGTTYYSTLSTGVKIPTRIGVDVKAMTDWNRGEYLNPQNTVPSSGLSYLGVEVQLGRGMFTDERRTQLKQANVYLNQSYAEQQLAINELLYKAGQEFIKWQEQNAQLSLALEGLQIAEERFLQLQTNALIGDRPIIDTVEASAQLFLRKLDVEQRKLDQMNSLLAVENYFWEKGMIPLQFDSLLRPAPLQINVPNTLLLDSVANHPLIQTYNYKLTDLSLQRKLKIEQLKPALSVNYNLLTPPSDLISSNYSWSNYKWGASFYMPVLLRKERASLNATRLKIENTELEQQFKIRELRTKQIQTRNEWNTVTTQSQTAFTIAARYRQLADAERSLFQNGESSLFLINAREIAYLSAQSKWIETVAKTNKMALTEMYLSGKLGF